MLISFDVRSAGFIHSTQKAADAADLAQDLAAKLLIPAGQKRTTKVVEIRKSSDYPGGEWARWVLRRDVSLATVDGFRGQFEFSGARRAGPVDRDDRKPIPGQPKARGSE